MNGATAEFIRAHADDDVRLLALKGTKDPDIDLPFALDQIAGRQTARRKLPTWAASDGIIFPPHLSMEQCSSEQTARYKAGVVGGTGVRGYGSTRMVDLTGGFGVDFSLMAQSFDEAVYVERNPQLCDIARHNFDVLGLNAKVVCSDAEDYLRQMPRVNLIYIDPARRDSQGQRTYGISDCTPDVVALRDLLMEKADRVLIKLSPMLDWRKAVSDLGETHVSEVHIVSVENECKELLIEETLQDTGLRVSCVNILHDNTIERFVAHTTTNSHSSPPVREGLMENLEGLYLYEPNASIMKAGCFAEVSEAFGVSQLAPNSHIFVSQGDPPPVGPPPALPKGRELLPTPLSPSEEVSHPLPKGRGWGRVSCGKVSWGRVFRIEAVTTLNKRELRTALAGITQANITVRNFPLTVAQLRQRLKLNEGGSTYIFATTLSDRRHVLLICRKTPTSVY